MDVSTDSRAARRSKVIVALLAFVAFVPSLLNGFVWDDLPLIVNNPSLTGDSAIVDAFTRDFWGGGAIVRGMESSYYRPLVTLSYVLDHALWGKTPLGFHLTNVLFHVAASLGFLAAAKRFGATARESFAAAALFAVHPIHLESVAWIAGRTDVMCATFLFFAIATKGPKSWVLGTLALLSKETAVMWPLLNIVRDRRLAWRERGPEFALVAAFLVARQLVLTKALGGTTFFDPAVSTVGMFHLFGLLAAPWLALPAYLVPLVTSSLVVGGVVGVAVVGGLVASALRDRRLVTWLMAAVLLLGPGLVVLYQKQILGTRLAYASSGFLLLVAVAGVLRVARTRGRVYVFAATLVVCTVFTAWETRHWRDNLTFWRWTASVAATRSEVHVNIAINEHDAGELAAAWRSLGRVDPGKQVPERHYMLGLILAEVGCFDRAAQEYERAVALDASYAAAWINLAALHRVQRRPNAALEVIARAKTAGVGARELARIGEKAKADAAAGGGDRPLRVCSRRVEEILADPEALTAAALARGREGEVEQAESLVRAALRLRPGWAPALYTRAQVRYLAGDFAAAVKAGEAAVAAGETLALKVVGLARLKTGKTGEGKAALREYLAKHPNAPDRDELARLAAP